MAPASRPNIIVCTCDQMRPFELGCHGHPVVKTPHLDELADGGVRFETAVTCDPLCTAARSSLLSGQYSRTCTGFLGCCGEPHQSRAGFPDATLPEILKAHGYSTHLLGKWHIAAHPRALGFDRYVFPKVHHLNTDQVYFDGDEDGATVPGFSPEFEMARLAETLKSAPRPFFLYYNISLPHMPYFDVPQRYRHMYSPEQVVLRPNVWKDGRIAEDEHWFRIYYYDYLYYKLRLPDRHQLPEGFNLRAMTAMYYGMISCVDDQIGHLKRCLDGSGLAGDTLLVFTSDHGDNLGSHHLFNKVHLNEESIRIPLVFSWPGTLQPGVNTEQVASIVDLMPTILALTGGPRPEGAQGRDLSAVVRGETACLRDNWAFVECFSGEVGIRTRDHVFGIMTEGSPHGPVRPVTDDNHQFFDLRTDPFQMNNLASTPEQADLRRTLQSRVLDWHEKTPWLKG